MAGPRSDSGNPRRTCTPLRGRSDDRSLADEELRSAQTYSSPMRGFTGLTREISGPFRWTRPVVHPTFACAAISSATLCDVLPGHRRSDTIEISTCRLADSSWDPIGSMSAETSGRMACFSGSLAALEQADSFASCKSAELGPGQTVGRLNGRVVQHGESIIPADDDPTNLVPASITVTEQ